jgi:amino acid transporter
VSAVRWVQLVLVLLVVSVTGLFWVQNGSRTADLSLDLYFFGFQTAAPQPLPLLLLAALGVGLVAGGGWGLVQHLGDRSRIRELEDQLARNTLGRTSSDWG